MNPIKIGVMFTQTFDREPLAVISPFYSIRSALTPKELRAIAATLNMIADDAFDHPTTKRTFRNVTRTYEVNV